MPEDTSLKISGPFSPSSVKDFSWTLIAPPDSFGTVSFQNGTSRLRYIDRLPMLPTTLNEVAGSPWVWAIAGSGARPMAAAAATAARTGRIDIIRSPRGWAGLSSGYLLDCSMLGSHSAMSGKAIRMPIMTIIAPTNGRAPRHRSENGPRPRTDWTT